MRTCAVLLATACQNAEGTAPEADSTGEASGFEGGACTKLFGRPALATGLGSDQCGPSCPCLDGWVAPSYDAAAVQALRDQVLLEPRAALTADPYDQPAPPPSSSAVCAVLIEVDGYRLATFSTRAEAEAAGGQVTHGGPCGLCSPLQDLAVYIERPDLTQPVRDCGVVGLSQGGEAIETCLRNLGFSRPCAQIWRYNTEHTSETCLDVCIRALDEPYHRPDGTLNACLQCDEDQSGPWFRPIAGRTRRNTGLASALCRPCDRVLPLVHVYE